MENKKFRLKLLKVHKFLNFNNFPIVIKLIIGFSFIFIVMILLSYISFSNYKKDKDNGTLDIINQMNRQAVSKIDDFIQDLNSITKLPLIREDGNYSTLFNKLEEFNETGVVDFDFSKLVELELYKILYYKPYIQSVFIFNLKGKGDYTMRGNTLFSSGFNPVNEKWFQESIAEFGKPIPISTFAISNVSEVKNNKIYVFSVARGIIKIENAKIIGVMLVNCNISFFTDLYKNMLITPNQKVIVLDNDGNIVYDENQENLSKKYTGPFIKYLEQKPKINQYIKLQGIEYMVSSDTSELTGWKVINIIPLNELNQKIYQIRDKTFLVTFILSVLALLFVFFISIQIIRPLKKLVLLMKLFEKGDFDVKIRFKNHDEVGQLAKTFNNMTRKIKKLIKEVYIDKIVQKDLELQMLQYQINPHFLYNTLESINMMAEIKNVEEISEMTIALSKILRYGISKKQEIVTVREEIEHLSDYILLQKVRFEDIFSITVKIDEDIYENHIIKFILQPIVENAIYHGLVDKSRDGKIDILGYKKDTSIIFEIIDNGKGMEASQLQRMNQYINGLDNTFKSIGLKNVNKRIKLYYSDDYGIEVSSTVNIGTTVKVTLPGTL